jgi:putative endonuclease
MGSKITSVVAVPASHRTALGNAAEEHVLSLMLARGWRLLHRHYRSPGRGGGEIDLIMRDRDDVLVFVEVRQRSSQQWGGAMASVTRAKQRRIIWAARHFLARWKGDLPFCRFDVVALEPDGVKCIRGAFTL